MKDKDLRLILNKVKDMLPPESTWETFACPNCGHNTIAEKVKNATVILGSASYFTTESSPHKTKRCLICGKMFEKKTSTVYEERE